MREPERAQVALDEQGIEKCAFRSIVNTWIGGW
jgi:hypothetical protein